MPWLSDEASQLPIIISLSILVVGLYFRGTVLWISVTLVLCFLLIVDRDSIITLVIYGFTATLLIGGYRRIRMGQASKNISPDYSSVRSQGIIVVDSNNLLGLVNWDLGLFQEFISELEADGFSVHLFFDHSIQRLLKQKKLIEPTETVPMTLCRVMGMNRHQLTVSKKGHKADALLVRHADRNRLTVLSNDRFNKKSDDKFYLEAAKRLNQAGLIKRVGLVEGKLTIL